MALASLNDVNKYLPTDKIAVTDLDDDDQQLAAERIIKGHLGGVFLPATLAGWDTPTNTPGLIREIAGRIIAALRYRQRASHEIGDNEPSKYAQQLYLEAMADLRGIMDGSIVLVDVTTENQPVGTLDMTTDDFAPNDASASPAVFRMDLTF